jgi:hypothetical protein
MAPVNTGRVLIGGLLAGLLFNAGDALINMVLLAGDIEANLRRLGINPQIAADTRVIASWMIIDFAFGLLVVWTYAGFRPRFGPGPATAILAALPAFLGATLVLLGFHHMGIFSMAAFWKGTLYSAVNFAIGSLAGAAVYKEA